MENKYYFTAEQMYYLHKLIDHLKEQGELLDKFIEAWNREEEE